MRIATGLIGLVLACGAAPEAAPATCSVVLTPDAALEAVTVSWAEQWSAATGCAVTVGAGGVPVLARDSAIDSESNGVCGTTERVETVGGVFLRPVSITIDTTPPARCAPWGVTLGHEMAHAMSGCDHSDDAQSLLAAEPVSGKVHTVDPSAVLAVCDAIACPIDAAL